MMYEVNFSVLVGKTLISIENRYNTELTFITDTGEVYKAFHEQDCCEIVIIKDIEGNLNDLMGTPIIEAEEVTNNENTFDKVENPESFTWTFYKLATIKGYVTISWLGESNGYYSESVKFFKYDWD